MIDSYLLEYFLAVLEEGTLLKASERLSVSQPSLTKAMQKLEALLGLELFDRSPNRIVLNENGREMAEYARNILQLEGRMLEKAKELKAKESTYKVAMTAPGPTFRFPNAFIFKNASHSYDLAIQGEEACLRDVLNGVKDLAFVNHRPDDPGLYSEEIMVEKLYASLPRGNFLFRKKDGVAFSELDGQSFLVSRSIGIWKAIIERELPHSRFFYQSEGELQDIVDASSIPAFATDITLLFRENPDRVFLPILDESAKVPFYAVTAIKNRKIIEDLKAEG